MDHRMHLHRGLLPGFSRQSATVSKMTLLLSCAREDEDDVKVMADECYQKLLRTTALQYLIQDRNKLRTRDGFVGFANLADAIQREGIRDANRDRSHKCLRVVTHDTYQ